MDPALAIVAIVFPLFAIIVLMIVFVRKAYHVCGLDEVMYRTGVGGPEVVTAGGMLAHPIIHQVRVAKLHSVPITEHFASSSALVFKDATRVCATIEFWVRLDNTPDALLEAYVEMGEKVSDADHIQRYIGKNFREALVREAAKIESNVWAENPKEFCWKVAADDLGEHFLQVSHVTVAIDDQT